MLYSKLCFLSRQQCHPEPNQTAIMRTKSTSTTPNGTSVTHYTHEGAGSPTSTTYQSHEKHLLAFPALLVGPQLLKIAETNSNQQISEKVSAARKTADGPILSSAEVAIRITAALQSRAEETGVTLEQAQSAFAAIRKDNGILFIILAFRPGKKEEAITTVEDSATADASDSELSEFETDDEQ
jgi:hypothetical protein